MGNRSRCCWRWKRKPCFLESLKPVVQPTEPTSREARRSHFAKVLCFVATGLGNLLYKARSRPCDLKLGVELRTALDLLEPHIQPAWLIPQFRHNLDGEREHEYAARKVNSKYFALRFRDQKFSPSASRKAGSNGFLSTRYNTIPWTSRNGIRKHIPAITTKKNHPQGA